MKRDGPWEALLAIARPTSATYASVVVWPTTGVRMSSGGVLRWMHYQGQTEAVGTVLDDAVMTVTDVRFSSPAQTMC
jgi:hypothetical protein